MTPKQLLTMLEMPLALARPSPLPVLECVLIQDGHVTATTLDTTIEVDLSDDVELKGVEGCVDARRLALALNTLDQGSGVIFKQKGPMLTLRCGGSTRTLQMLPASDFPLPVWGEGEVTCIKDPSLLTMAIRSVKHAVATSTLRPLYCGIGARSGALFATDGFRAARVKGAAQDCGIDDGIILPTEVLDNLHKLADMAAQEGAKPLHAMSVGQGGTDKRAYMVQHANWRMQFQLVGAEPAPIDRVMVADNPQILVQVSRDALRFSARNIARLAAASPNGKKAPCARLTVTPSAQDAATLRLELATANVSPDEETFDRLSCNYSGDKAWECGVNPFFLADALDALDGDTVSIVQLDPTKRTALLLSGKNERLNCLIQPFAL